MRVVAKFAFTLLLVVALAEAGAYAALIALGASDKSFAEIYDPTGNTARFGGKCDDYILTLELNPYLAFTPNRQCSGTTKGLGFEYRVNNLGLLNQDVDIKKENYFSIGIFGGSVAAQFAGTISSPQIEEMLNSCFISKSGKPFRVLNLANGAWKQPQQVIALALYGDYIDAAISIEGFNERDLLKKGTTADILLPAPNYSSLISDGSIRKYYFKLSNLKDTIASRSNTIKLFTLLFRKDLESVGYGSFKNLIEKYSIEGIDVVQHNIKRYIGFIKSFDSIASSKDMYSLIVLQPAPLHKQLSISEAKVVGQLDYEEPYREIAALLNNNARSFLNLSDLFSRTEGPVFSDSIHFIALNKNFNSYGNYRMATEIIHKLESDNEIRATANSAKCLTAQEPS
jgi:hypothetical protein